MMNDKYSLQRNVPAVNFVPDELDAIRKRVEAKITDDIKEGLKQLGIPIKHLLHHPYRVQRKRTAGYKHPTGAIYVGRGTRYGNPFRIGVDGSREECIARYRAFLMSSPLTLRSFRHQLKGKILSCFCPLNEDCHADVLLDLVNNPQP